MRGADFTLDRLKPDDIALGEAITPGVPVELYKQYRVNQIQKTGRWQTVDKERGLALVYQDDAGRYVPVIRADGTLFQMNWSELSSATVPKAASDARVSGIKATGKL